jgi:hypothetical protein
MDQSQTQFPLTAPDYSALFLARNCNFSKPRPTALFRNIPLQSALFRTIPHHIFFFDPIPLVFRFAARARSLSIRAPLHSSQQSEPFRSIPKHSEPFRG